MPRQPSTSRKKIEEQKVGTVHRHFRLTPHPPHHEHYHHALLIVILVIILIGVGFLASDHPLGYVVRERGKAALPQPPSSPSLPSDQEYRRQVNEQLRGVFSMWDVSEEAIKQARGVKQDLMDMRVPRKYLDAHLGLVLVVSAKEQALEKALGGDSKPLEKVKEDSNAFLESYSWLKL